MTNLTNGNNKPTEVIKNYSGSQELHVDVSDDMRHVVPNSIQRVRLYQDSGSMSFMFSMTVDQAFELAYAIIAAGWYVEAKS